MRVKIFTVIMVVFTMAIIGCASYKPGQVAVNDVTQYTNIQSHNGIDVAVDLYSEEMKTKESFYLNVNEKNYYPVNLIVKNNSNNKLLLIRNNVDIVDSIGNIYSPCSCVVMTSEFERNKMAYALLGFGIFSYMSAEEANNKMETDWRDKELADEIIINPRRRNSGFIYFKFPVGSKPKGMTLKLAFEALETGETIPFEITL